MTDWFREAFAADYLALYAHRTEEEAEQAVDLIRRVTGVQPGDRVLDAPCGAGRHARAFAAAGLRVTGFDLSAELLRAASAHRPGDGLVPCYVRGDIRRLPFRPGRFPLVTNLFSSLGYFETEQENADTLCGLIRVCAERGWIVVDFMNAPQVRATLQPRSERTTPGGIRVVDERRIEGDPPRVVKRTQTFRPDGSRRDFLESVRLFEPDDLIRIMDRCGAPVTESFGDYGGGSYGAGSPRLILFGRKR